MKMTRSELYKKLNGKTVACLENNSLFRYVGLFKSGRMCFTVTHFEPLKRMEPNKTTYFLRKGDYIEDLGEYILVRRSTNNYLFIFHE